MTANTNISDAKNKSVTPEIVKDMFKKYNNSVCFLAVFGTTKFNNVSDEKLNEMFNFLSKKI